MERSTRQRAAIQGAIQRLERPLSPGEILEHARADVPTISLQTVYRALKSLTDEGLIRVVEIPGQSPRYEMSGLAHHHHFRCDCCGRVFDIPGPCPKEIVQGLPKGFRVREHEVTLFGRCADCPEGEGGAGRGGFGPGCSHGEASGRGRGR